MGYTLIIGEAELYYDNDFDSPICMIIAELHSEPEAPAFGEPTDHKNQRCPSYSIWSDFVKFVGLYDLFFDGSDRLMANHPGCVPLTIRHKNEIDAAYKKFKEKHPDAVATYGDEDNPIKNSYLCRLEWLKWWADWALKYCGRPVFYNS